MRRCVAVAALIIAGLIGYLPSAKAQSAILNLPRVSQHARFTQRIGLTDITIDYHRPLVNGRKIFGGLQAYGQVWRAGANDNTLFEVSDPVTINGQPLPKGVYGLHMIPGENSWIIIFSKNSTSWGSFTYDKSEDALRVTVTAQPIENHETLSYDFDDPRPNSVVITMRWEKVAVPFKVEVNTTEITEKSLRNQLRARAQFEWSPWMEAANYLLDNKLSAEEALKYAERSIENEDRFENEITKSRVLSALGRKDEALAAHDKAIAMGTQLQVQVFARTLQAQGRQDEALELFRINIKKDPNSWVGHNNAARVAVSKGDFDRAIREMKLAATAAPESLKGAHADLVRRLQNHEDINK
jgi:tetratricopeptide (TPR) repeat protein